MKKDIRVLLIAINVLLLAALILMVLFRQTFWQPPKPISPALSQKLSTAFLQKLDLSAGDYPQITQRPLFWPSRKPPPEKKVEKAPVVVAYPFENATLLGTYFDNENAGVIIRLDKDKKVIRLSRGQTYEGWKLEELSPISALFVDADHHQRTMQIEQAKQANEPSAVAKPQNNSATESGNGKPPQLRWVPKLPQQKN